MVSKMLCSTKNWTSSDWNGHFEKQVVQIMFQVMTKVTKDHLMSAKVIFAW